MRGTGEADMQKSVPIFALGLSILLVDHDASSLASIASMLQRHSYNGNTHKSALTCIFDTKGYDSTLLLIFRVLTIFSIPVTR